VTARAREAAVSAAGPDSGSRLARRFALLRERDEAAFVPFVMSGDRGLDTTATLLDELVEAGADVIELGVPFSDPMADDPSIQKGGLRALKSGATLGRVLAMVRDFRKEDDTTPIVLMGYFNPILSYGVDSFCTEAAASGVDGLIVVDVPPEEADEIEPQAKANGLDLIRLIAPTTDDERLPRVLAATSGFVYYVSITGITGTRSASAADLSAAIPRIRKHTDLPICIGFGIRTPEQAAEAARIADGAVVGTALVDTLAASLDEEGRAKPDTVRKVLDQVRALSEAVRAAKKAG